MNRRAAERLRTFGERLRADAAGAGLALPTPSPLEPTPSLPEPWARARILVKRDDRLGPGGTKVRKLASALPAAKAAGRRVVATFGHEDSNHALATARAAASAGLGAELWLQAGTTSAARRDAYTAAAREVRYRRGAVGLAAGAFAHWLAAAPSGGAPWLMPPGGTTPATCAAVACMVVEIADQLAAAGEPIPERWAVAVGTGGTLAGLCAGVRALELPSQLVGFGASDPALVRPALVAALANAALDRLGLPGHLGADEVELDDSQLGTGHGVPTEASRRAEAEWAGAGVPLDPIFGAKAAAGLRARIEAGPPGQRWLFLHTGLPVEPPP